MEEGESPLPEPEVPAGPAPRVHAHLHHGEPPAQRAVQLHPEQSSRGHDVNII